VELFAQDLLLLCSDYNAFYSYERITSLRRTINGPTCPSGARRGCGTALALVSIAAATAAAADAKTTFAKNIEGAGV